MNVQKLERGQHLSVVSINGVELVCNGKTEGAGPFTNVSDRSSVEVDSFEIWEVSATDVMSTEFAPEILDEIGNAYYKMGRPRPRNIFIR